MDKRYKFSFATVCVLLELFFQVGYSLQSSDTTIRGEYILLSNHEHSVDAKREFFSRLKQRLGVTITSSLDIPFGKYRVYLIYNLTDEHAECLRNDVDLEIVETNRHVKAIATSYKEFIHEAARPKNTSSEATFCFEQNTGRNLWGLSRINQRDKLGLFGKYHWGYNDDGTGVDVYVIDSGCFIEHEEFGGRAMRGFTATQLFRTEGEDDLNGHGTHVSGTIAGTTFGVAKAANVIAVKALDKDGVGSIADIVEGLSYIYNDFMNNKKSRGVINLSLGSFGTSAVLEHTLDLCIEAGINVVVASGNDFDDSCLYTPAHVAKAITVGASGLGDVVSVFSNFGSCIDLFAPGESIISAYIGGTNTYAISDGTSMASPHAAGAIARYLSHPSTTVPSPTDVALYFDLISTKGAIDFSALSATHAASLTQNKLLYVECSRATTIYSKSSFGFYFLVMILTYFCA